MTSMTENLKPNGFHSNGHELAGEDWRRTKEYLVRTAADGRLKQQGVNLVARILRVRGKELGRTRYELLGQINEQWIEPETTGIEYKLGEPSFEDIKIDTPQKK